MDEQERICAKCGQACSEGHNFCFNCGASLSAQEQSEPEQIESEQPEPEKLEHEQPEQSIQEAPKKIKRNKYKARKFVSLGFAIADILVALSFWICAIIFEKVSHLLYYDKGFYAIGSSEYKLSKVSDIYYAFAGAGYILAAFFALGSVISLIMFFVYVRKRRKFKLALELEVQEIQEPIFEEIEEIEEVTEEAEEQAKEKEPQMENQESQNQEQV